MKRCSRCILPDNYPNIEFDNNSVCSQCHSWQNMFDAMDYVALREELDGIVEDAKSRARQADAKYDVIVPVSGGKDSAYALYVLKEIYDCRVYAFNINNGFSVPLAQQNLAAMAEHFDVDLEIRSLPLSLMKSGYKAFLAQGGEFCTMCEGTGYWLVADLVLRFMKVTGSAPLVVGGWSHLFEFESGVYEWDMQHYYKVLSDYGIIDRLFQHLDKDALDVLIQDGDPRQGTSFENSIQLPNYWPWERQEIYRQLEKIGWHAGPQSDTHFDCWANPVANWLTYRLTGINQPLITDASLVRASQMNREEALRREEKRNKDRPPEADQFLAFLGIEENELNCSDRLQT